MSKDFELKDSGNRTKFDTGSTKDIQEGRGRYDLIPLLSLSGLYNEDNDGYPKEMFLYEIHNAIATDIVMTKDTYLRNAIKIFVNQVMNSSLDKVVPSLAILYEKGADKYSARDWEKGRPMEVFINSALRHFYQYLNGETDEDHATAVVWNLLSCIDTIYRFPGLAYTYKAPHDPNGDLE